MNTGSQTLGADETNGSRTLCSYPQTNEPSARKRQNECRRHEALEKLEMVAIGMALSSELTSVFQSRPGPSVSAWAPGRSAPRPRIRTCKSQQADQLFGNNRSGRRMIRASKFEMACFSVDNAVGVSVKKAAPEWDSGIPSSYRLVNAAGRW